MAKSEKKSSGMWTFIRIMLLLAMLVGLVLFGLVFYRGLQAYQNGEDPAIVQNQTIINTNITEIQQGPTWPFYLTSMLLFIAVGVIIYLTLKKRTKFGRRIDIRKPAEQAMEMLVEMGHPFYYRVDGHYERIRPQHFKKKKGIGALTWTLPGTGMIYFKRDVRFMRVLLRFWAYPRDPELQTEDSEPPAAQVYTVSVDPNNVYYEPQFLGSMKMSKLWEFIHKQEYGFIPAPVPAAAENIIDARLQEKLQEGAVSVFEQFGRDSVQ